MKKHIAKAINLILSVLCILLMAGCSQTEEVKPPATDNNKSAKGIVSIGPKSYDSADTCVVCGINESESTITFLNIELLKKYTLSFDKTTSFKDRYGKELLFEDIKIGEIADTTFLKSKKHLTTLQISPNSFRNDDVTEYTLDFIKQEIHIGSENYKLNKDILFCSDGVIIDPMELVEADTLSIRGIDREIFSITVERGHGYLRLQNDEYFVGGWIEVGPKIITKISKDMLLTVPEGEYQVNISNKGSGGIKNVIINKNQETVLDIGDLEIVEEKFGNVLFSVTPDKTAVYIDGSQVDISVPVSLSYGIHQMIAKAEGYDTIVKYLSVGQESAGIDITLEKSDSDDDEEDDEAAETVTVSDYYKVYVDSPEGAEVYLDGTYIGVAPCNFKKVAGTHIITLKKTGFETRSYTVSLEDDDNDFSYSFAELSLSTNNE